MQVEIIVDGEAVAVLTEYKVLNPDDFRPISYYRLDGDRKALPKGLFNHDRIVETQGNVRHHGDEGRDVVVRGADSGRDGAVE